MPTNPVPEGYHTVTPYMIVDGAAAAIDFYKNALGARELRRVPMGDGKIGHAEMMVGDTPIMLADEFPEMNYRGPKHYGGTPVSLALYVDDVDGLFDRAVSAGATVRQPVQDKFYGDRSGTIED